MNTLLQAFARLPQSEPDSNWIAWAVLIASGVVVGFLAGLTYRRWTYLRGYGDGIKVYLAPPEKPQPGDINCPPPVFANATQCRSCKELSALAHYECSCPSGVDGCIGTTISQKPTIKISPRNVPPKSPFTVSREGQLAQDMGWHKGGREIGNGNG